MIRKWNVLVAILVISAPAAGQSKDRQIVDAVGSGGAKALGAGAGRMEREPAGPLVRLSEPFGGDGDDLVFVNTAESCGRILTPDPPGPSSPPHQPVEHHALADLDEGHVAHPRGTTLDRTGAEGHLSRA